MTIIQGDNQNIRCQKLLENTTTIYASSMTQLIHELKPNTINLLFLAELVDELNFNGSFQFGCQSGELIETIASDIATSNYCSFSIRSIEKAIKDISVRATNGIKMSLKQRIRMRRLRTTWPLSAHNHSLQTAGISRPSL